MKHLEPTRTTIDFDMNIIVRRESISSRSTPGSSPQANPEGRSIRWQTVRRRRLCCVRANNGTEKQALLLSTMAGRSGRRGELVLPEERESFLESLKKETEESWLSADDDEEEEPSPEEREGIDGPIQFEASGKTRKRSSRRTSRRSSPLKEFSSLSKQRGNDGCLVCGKDDDHNNLMFCDKCQGQYHLYCLDPPLPAVPTGDWFCKACKATLPKIDDDLEKLVCALPPRYTERFGEIVWAQGGVGFGFWPAVIYDPRFTTGNARDLARKHLGRKHLVYFLECHMAPFSVLGDSKLCEWECGLAEDYHLGKAAHGHGKSRGTAFRQALHIACLEEGKPISKRMVWYHSGYEASPTEHVPLSPVPVKVRKKRGRTEEKDDEKKSRRKKKEKNGTPATLGSAERQNLQRTLDLHSGNKEIESLTEVYCRVIKREMDESGDDVDERLGFVTLESDKATFLDARLTIQDEMDPDSLPTDKWKFYLPSLGTVSNRQEQRLGPVAGFLRKAFDAKLGDGSVENPFHLVIVNT